MELTTAARRMLLGIPEVKSYTQDRIWKDRLEEGIHRTGGRAIVVSEQPWWATPDPVATHEWPVLWVDCYADSDRDENGLIRKANALDKARALARVVDTHLQNVRGVRWGTFGSTPGLTIVTCQRWGNQVLTAGEGRDASIGDATHRVNDVQANDTEVMLVRTKWALDVIRDGAREPV